MSEEHAPGDEVTGEALKVPCVAAILTNAEQQVLLQLRDDAPGLSFAGCWTLPGGRVETGEDADDAVRREVLEELSIRPTVSLWRVYERPHLSDATSPITIVQFVYRGSITDPIEDLATNEGKEIRFVTASEVSRLPIGFGFETLLRDFFSEKPPT
jgi:mutator protein MutT